MAAVDHRFALGHTPALPSACSKKSLASVSSPILACSVFTSTGGLAAAAFSDPNTSAAPSRSCAFHWVIWLGWTSNCWASSVRVFSPFTAARATLALKAGEWFRRGRLLIASPVRQPFWLWSGRNSTYPTVQISRASSGGHTFGDSCPVNCVVAAARCGTAEFSHCNEVHHAHARSCDPRCDRHGPR